MPFKFKSINGSKAWMWRNWAKRVKKKKQFFQVDVSTDVCVNHHGNLRFRFNLLRSCLHTMPLKMYCTAFHRKKSCFLCRKFIVSDDRFQNNGHLKCNWNGCKENKCAARHYVIDMWSVEAPDEMWLRVKSVNCNTVNFQTNPNNMEINSL